MQIALVKRIQGIEVVNDSQEFAQIKVAGMGCRSGLLRSSKRQAHRAGDIRTNYGTDGAAAVYAASDDHWART